MGFCCWVLFHGWNLIKLQGFMQALQHLLRFNIWCLYVNSVSSNTKKNYLYFLIQVILCLFKFYSSKYLCRNTFFLLKKKKKILLTLLYFQFSLKLCVGYLWLKAYYRDSGSCYFPAASGAASGALPANYKQCWCLPYVLVESADSCCPTELKCLAY